MLLSVNAKLIGFSDNQGKALLALTDFSLQHHCLPWTSTANSSTLPDTQVKLLKIVNHSLAGTVKDRLSGMVLVPKEFQKMLDLAHRSDFDEIGDSFER